MTNQYKSTEEKSMNAKSTAYLPATKAHEGLVLRELLRDMEVLNNWKIYESPTGETTVTYNIDSSNPQIVLNELINKQKGLTGLLQQEEDRLFFTGEKEYFPYSPIPGSTYPAVKITTSNTKPKYTEEVLFNNK